MTDPAGHTFWNTPSAHTYRERPPADGLPAEGDDTRARDTGAAGTFPRDPGRGTSPCHLAETPAPGRGSSG